MGPRCSTRSERSRPVLVQPDLADRGGQMGAQAAADMTPPSVVADCCPRVDGSWEQGLRCRRALEHVVLRGGPHAVAAHSRGMASYSSASASPDMPRGRRRSLARGPRESGPSGRVRQGLGGRGRTVPCRCRARRPDQRSCFIRYGFAVSDKSDPLADCLPRAVDRGEGSGCLARRQTSQRRSAHHPGDSVADARGRARFTGPSPCVVVPRHFRFGRRPPQWLDHRARRRDGRLTRANVTTPLASTLPSGPRPGARRWVCQPSRRLLS